ncbi:MAG TPA: sugar phosphate nucleotidyltransferase [Candidatus Paceibacterota bacterium]|nr:sugar phosphate nucleotidyltransferase [Verrucomicrobiota bacterium]HRZ46009.1 sugar phosphate nucleotidyltransferase [Candidatus Paceibacterota bacterium]
MEIKKAIVTAAGRNQQTLPLQTLVDRDGESKTALRIIIEEVLAAGIDQIALILPPRQEDSFAAAAGAHAGRLRFITQDPPLGFGHAVHCARHFVGHDPFLLLVGDHLYVSHERRNCAQQLIDVARQHQCAVSAVQATHESKLPYYGAVGGRLLPSSAGLYAIETVLEKPTPTQAEQSLIVPGLRHGHYLCFFGMHVLTAAVMELLERLIQSRPPPAPPIQLAPALAELSRQEQYLAHEIRGRRYDIGLPYGLLVAQLALGLEGRDRSEILAQLVEILALRHASLPAPASHAPDSRP